MKRRKGTENNMRFIRRTRLQDWCLQVVIENLNSYMHSDAVPPWHIDYLLRLYSEEVFEQYRISYSITEDRMIWFLNPHNKKIDLRIITENVVRRIQVVGSTITSLIMHESSATENMLNSIACCIPNIEYLDLSITDCSDKTLLCLQKMCPNLETLNVSECEDITNEGMKNLCGPNMSLKKLNIKITNVGATGVHSILKGMPSLTILKYENLAEELYHIHEQDFIRGTYKNIQYNLAELSYQGVVDVDDPLRIVWVCTFLCPNLRKITFHFSVNEHIMNLCVTRFTKLEEITLRHFFFNKLVVCENILRPVLIVSHNIRKLTLCRVEIPLVTLLENFKNLDYLYLDRVNFTDFPKDDFKITETKLDTLIVTHLDFSARSPTKYQGLVVLLSVSKNVTKLVLNEMSSVPYEISHVILNAMKKLVYVDFSFTDVKLKNIMDFFHASSTKNINLELGSNCFRFNQLPTLKNALTENSACTLSWCISYNDESDDRDSDVYAISPWGALGLIPELGNYFR